MSNRPAVSRLEFAGITLATLGFLVASTSLPARDQPLGTDWYAYAQNALALSEGPLSAYDHWRGPVHAWACLALARPFGSLVAASQAVSAVSLTAALPLTWWLGRAVVGRTSAALATLLLACNADFLLFSRTSTPYPLFTMLLLASFAASWLAWEKQSARWAALAGGLIGVAAGTDARCFAYALPVLAISGVVTSPNSESRAQRLTRLSILGIAIALTWAMVRTICPVELVSLPDQFILQRNLNHAGFPGICGGPEPDFPGLDEWFSRCGRDTFRLNLARADAAVPIPWAYMFALSVVGLFTRADDQRARAWLLAIPLLPLFFSLPIVGVEHRHVLPVAPYGALLLAAGGTGVVDRLARRAKRGDSRVTFVLCTVLVGWFARAWYRHPGSPSFRARSGLATQGHAPAQRLGDTGGIIGITRMLRDDADPQDRIVDCARAGLNLRLYPTRVEENGVGPGGRASSACRRMLAAPSVLTHTTKHTWLLTEVRADDAVATDWMPLTSYGAGEGRVTLYRR